MSIFTTHKDEPNIKLDDFAKSYKSLLEGGIHGTLLTKCMSDYSYNQINLTDTCFSVDGTKILDKDGQEVVLNYNDARVSVVDLSNVGYGTDITFNDILDKGNFASYNADLNTFMDDWKDLRTSLGDIPFEANGKIDMSGLTSSKLEHYHDEFDEHIRTKHKDILKQRNNLDNKMRELYGEKGDADFNLDASVYSTMLFTIMTTSLLYYLFIKI